VVPFSEVMNEHRVFFPYVGLTLAVVWAAVLAADRLAVRRLEGAGTLRTRVAAAAAMIVLAALGVSTWSRNRIWKTEESLWRDVTEKSPANGRGLMNYGLTRMRQGDYAGANASFTRAGALLPNYSTLEINRGIVEAALGQRFSAEAHFRRALELAPDADGHFFYARWLAEAGRGPEAIRASPLGDRDQPRIRGCAASPDAPGVGGRRPAGGCGGGGRDARARSRRRRGLGVRARRHPRWPPAPPTSAAAMSAGLAALAAKRHDEAAELFRQVIRLDPRSADGWNNRGWAQLQLGFPAAAAASFERALAIEPASERVRNNLALAAGAPLIGAAPPKKCAYNAAVPVRRRSSLVETAAFLLVLAGALTYVIAHVPPAGGYQMAADEGIYYHQASAIVQAGPRAFAALANIYVGNEALQGGPSPSQDWPPRAGRSRPPAEPVHRVALDPVRHLPCAPVPRGLPLRTAVVGRTDGRRRRHLYRRLAARLGTGDAGPAGHRSRALLGARDLHVHPVAVVRPRASLRGLCRGAVVVPAGQGDGVGLRAVCRRRDARPEARGP
jgi:tetratricopeptide (TPR) repeat protein